jgi:hypothetical protein
MLLVFQTLFNEANLRQIYCKFNLVTYGCLMFLYPILYIANFNWLFFIGISCILFPQIYTNGKTGIRPDLNSPYYLKFILVRFAIIVIILII